MAASCRPILLGTGLAVLGLLLLVGRPGPDAAISHLRRRLAHKDKGIIELLGDGSKKKAKGKAGGGGGEDKASYDYAKLYERLYQTGYHNLEVNSNAFGGFWVNPGVLMRIMLEPEYQIGSVLDVGCSHGMAVAALWDFGKAASGMDVSTTAVQMAEGHAIEKYVGWSTHGIRERDGGAFCDAESKTFSSHCFFKDHPDRPRPVEEVKATRQCNGPCFQQGSATKVGGGQERGSGSVCVCVWRWVGGGGGGGGGPAGGGGRGGGGGGGVSG